MVRLLVFFSIAALIGCAIWVVVARRLRAAARQPDVAEGDLCQLEQAHRISSVAVVASLVGLALVGLLYVVF